MKPSLSQMLDNLIFQLTMWGHCSRVVSSSTTNNSLLIWRHLAPDHVPRYSSQYPHDWRDGGVGWFINTQMICIHHYPHNYHNITSQSQQKSRNQENVNNFGCRTMVHLPSHVIFKTWFFYHFEGNNKANITFEGNQLRLIIIDSESLN